MRGRGRGTGSETALLRARRRVMRSKSPAVRRVVALAAALAAASSFGARELLAQAGDISQAIGDLPVGKRVRIHFQGEVVEPVSAGATQVLTQGTVSGTNFTAVSTDDPDLGGAADPTATPLVNTSPQLSIAKDDGGVSAGEGDDVTYTLVYENTGNQDAGAVTIEETVPADTTFNAAASDAGWVCVPDANPGSLCTLNIGVVAGSGAGGSAIFVVTVDDPVTGAPTEITNTAEIFDGAVSYDTDSDTTPLILGFDLELVKIDTLDPVRAGTVQVYSYLVNNLGPGSANLVELDDVLPPETTFLFSSPGSPTCVELAGAFHCDLGNLAAGESAEVVIMVRVDGDFAGTVVNNATVSADEPDLDPGNDSVAEPTLVERFRKAVSVPDLNTNLSSEVAVLLRDPVAMTTTLRVRDSATGALLLSTSYPQFAGWDPIDLALVPSIAPAAGPGVAALLRDPISGRVRTVVKSLITGANHRVFPFPPHVPIGLATFTDFNANGADEIGALFKRLDTGGVFFMAKDATTGAQVGGVGFNFADVPVNLAAVPDIGGSPAADAAFLLRRGTDRVSQVLIRDPVSKSNLRLLTYDPDEVPLSVFALADINANLSPEIAVLTKTRSDGMIHVDVKDSLTGVSSLLDFSPMGSNARPIAARAVPSFDANLFDEVSVLARRESGEMVVKTLDSGTGTELLRQGFGVFQSPLDLLILEDFGGTLAPEVGVFMRRLSNGLLTVRVKDGSSGAGLSTVVFP